MLKKAALRAAVCNVLLAAVPVSADPELERFDLEEGREVYGVACMICHEGGAAGAPEVGDEPAWAGRIDQGMEVLIRRSLEGYRGDKGFMPPRGGYSSLTDEEVANAVAYMVSESQ